MRNWFNRWVLFFALAGLGAVPAFAQTSNSYDSLVTAAQGSITGLSSPITTIFTALLGIAILVGVGLWLVSMLRKKHG